MHRYFIAFLEIYARCYFRLFFFQISGIDQQAAFGGQLMTGILHIYDGLMMRYADKNCVQERLATVTCMKTLLATSQTAKTSALNGK